VDSIESTDPGRQSLTGVPPSTWGHFRLQSGLKRKAGDNDPLLSLCCGPRIVPGSKSASWFSCV